MDSLWDARIRHALKNRMLCETTHLEHNISTRLDDFFY